MPDKECPDKEQLEQQSFAIQLFIDEVQKTLGIEDRRSRFRDYPDLFVAMVTHLLPKLNLDDSLQQFLLGTNSTMCESEFMAKLALKTLPFRGLRTLELGGAFGQVLHGLGADSTCVDPDICGIAEYNRENFNYQPLVRPEDYRPIPVRLSSDNWRDYLLPDSYDMTFSRYLLSVESGTSSDWRSQRKLDQAIRGYDADRDMRIADYNESADKQARQNLFAISARVTQRGGVILHQGENIGVLLFDIHRLGIPLIAVKSPVLSNNACCIYVFRRDFGSNG